MSFTFVHYRININSDGNTLVNIDNKNSIGTRTAISYGQQLQKAKHLSYHGRGFGFSDIGAFGNEISTANLDQLAKEGRILTNYHTNPVYAPATIAFLTGVDNHIGGIGTMYENIAPNQVGKLGYETYINNRVVTVAELLRDSGCHILMSGKWHLSGKEGKNGIMPYDRGFENVFTLFQSGAQHFNGNPYYAGGTETFLHNGTIVP